MQFSPNYSTYGGGVSQSSFTKGKIMKNEIIAIAQLGRLDAVIEIHASGKSDGRRRERLTTTQHRDRLLAVLTV